MLTGGQFGPDQGPDQTGAEGQGDNSGSGGGGDLVYAPPAPVGDITFGVTWLSTETIASFTAPLALLGLTAQTVGGRVLDVAAFAFQMAFKTARGAVSEGDWLTVDVDVETGKGSVIVDLEPGRYFRAWRVVNGAQIDGDWLEGTIVIS